MQQAAKNILILDILNKYGDIFDDRIGEMKDKGIPYFYVGDCLNYAVKFCKNNGWSPVTDSFSEVIETIKPVLTLCFIKHNMEGYAHFSDGFHFVVLCQN